MLMVIWHSVISRISSSFVDHSAFQPFSSHTHAILLIIKLYKDVNNFVIDVFNFLQTQFYDTYRSKASPSLSLSLVCSLFAVVNCIFFYCRIKERRPRIRVHYEALSLNCKKNTHTRPWWCWNVQATMWNVAIFAMIAPLRHSSEYHELQLVCLCVECKWYGSKFVWKQQRFLVLSLPHRPLCLRFIFRFFAGISFTVFFFFVSEWVRTSK